MLDLKSLAEDCDIAKTTLPKNIVVLRQTNQLRVMTTIIRDKDCDKGDFIFYLERTSSLVLERYASPFLSPFLELDNHFLRGFVDKRALDELSYLEKKVETPGGHVYNGLELSGRICGVEIVRAGGAMRTSFSRVFVDAPIGKILIQTSDIGEPLVLSSSHSKH